MDSILFSCENALDILQEDADFVVVGAAIAADLALVVADLSIVSLLVEDCVQFDNLLFAFASVVAVCLLTDLCIARMELDLDGCLL